MIHEKARGSAIQPIAEHSRQRAFTDVWLPRSIDDILQANPKISHLPTWWADRMPRAQIAAINGAGDGNLQCNLQCYNAIMSFIAFILT